MIRLRTNSMKDYLKEKIVRKIVNEVKKDISTLVPVRNLPHGTDENSKYIRQWESIEGREAKGCSNYLCKNDEEKPALVGAHVIKDGRKVDKNWYINTSVPAQNLSKEERWRLLTI